MTTQTVSVWMTPNPVTVTPETTLPEAHRLMKERRIRRLPVMDGDKLVGIVTWGDIREASPSDATSLDIYELHTLLAKLSVREIMTRSPITVRPTTSIARAAQLMLEHKIGGLPVVNRHGRLIGIITESDIFRVLVLGTAA
jgi:acetoin utilization protein AcuB